jgi:hypothetical protein
MDDPSLLTTTPSQIRAGLRLSPSKAKRGAVYRSAAEPIYTSRHIARRISTPSEIETGTRCTVTKI